MTIRGAGGVGKHRRCRAVDRPGRSDPVDPDGYDHPTPRGRHARRGLWRDVNGLADTGGDLRGWPLPLQGRAVRRRQGLDVQFGKRIEATAKLYIDTFFDKTIINAKRRKAGKE